MNHAGRQRKTKSVEHDLAAVHMPLFLQAINQATANPTATIRAIHTTTSVTHRSCRMEDRV